MTFANPASCQAILILDADFPVEHFPLILGRLSIVPSHEGEEKTIQTVPISVNAIRDLTDLHIKLDTVELLRGRYIVLPNVGTGHGGVLRRGFYEHYAKMPCVGGYVDGALPTGGGYQNIINGLDRNYGEKTIGVLQTSDNRREDCAKLGAHVSWVKWAEPTAEALRQACLAKESRISLSQPILPQLLIRSVDVTASKYLGVTNVQFNQQYNALIGGRGTGKSTLLEYIRWALCDQPFQSYEDDELSAIERKRKNLIEKTLTDVSGEVRITFELNGVLHIVKRKGGSRDIMLKIDGSDFQSVTENEIRRLLPIHAYSQKQLSDVGIRNEELKRLIRQPISDVLSALHDELLEVGKGGRESYYRVASKKEIEKEIVNLRREIESLRSQVVTYRGGLRGLSAEDKGIIDKKPAYQTEQVIIDNITREVELFRGKAADLKASLELYLEELGDISSLENAEILRTISARVDGLFGDMKAAVSQLQALFSENNLSDYDNLLQQWRDRKQSFDEQYAAAQESSNSNRDQLSEILKREGRLAEVEGILNRKLSELKQLGNPEEHYSVQRQRWIACHRRKIELLGREAEQFTALSDNLIKAEVVRNVDVAPIKEILKGMFEGTRIREERISSLLAHVQQSSDPLVAYTNLIDELREVAEFRHVDKGKVKPSVWQKQSPHANAKETHLLAVVFFLPKPCPSIRHSLTGAYMR